MRSNSTQRRVIAKGPLNTLANLASFCQRLISVDTCWDVVPRRRAGASLGVVGRAGTGKQSCQFESNGCRSRGVESDGLRGVRPRRPPKNSAQTFSAALVEARRQPKMEASTEGYLD